MATTKKPAPGDVLVGDPVTLHGERLTAVMACEDGFGGYWHCGLCDQGFGNNMSANSHVMDGHQPDERVMVWVCREHGPEAPL